MIGDTVTMTLVELLVSHFDFRGTRPVPCIRSGQSRAFRVSVPPKIPIHRGFSSNSPNQVRPNTRTFRRWTCHGLRLCGGYI